MYQKIVIVGNLGADPALRYTPAGQAVCNFNVAVGRKYKKDGAVQDETTWFKVTVWGNQAEPCNTYLKKGSKVLVEGRMTPDPTGHPRIWEAKDGTPHTDFEVTAGQVVFLTTKQQSEDF